MDDYLESSPTVNEATQKAQDLVEMLAKGGFKLTKFVSNVPSLVNRVDPKSQLPIDSTEKVLATDEETSHVLGSKWNHSRDTLVVSRGTTPDLNRPITQRVVLSLVSAVYNPIGLVAPYTVTARLLLKDIWRLSGQQCDNNLPDDFSEKFLEWAAELPKLSEITMPRSYFRGIMESVELHVFGDSSQDVFSAVAFLRAIVDSNEGTETQLAFVFGKARVAPMKALTIPKLELQAALLAARLKNEIQQALSVPVERTFMWTDSTTVLQRLHSIDKNPVFVANRVNEIFELTTVDEWNHVPTADNPADAGTRGLSANALLDSPWLKGPKFLMTPDWPFQPSEEILKTKLKNFDFIEVNTEPVYQETTANTASVASNVLALEWQKYSSYEKLLRIVAYILHISPKFSCNRTKTRAITDPVELESAEQKFFLLIQSESFPNETKSLLKSDCFRIENPREWYLRHHPVFHPHKPGRVRRMLNGAAKFHGVSLNTKLLTGPDLLQTFIHVLMRFRQHPYAVSADIEGMFLQVGVIPEDRPSLRFLWREDPPTDVAVYQYVRHIFGSKDSPTCANYALQQTDRDNRI